MTSHTLPLGSKYRNLRKKVVCGAAFSKMSFHLRKRLGGPLLGQLRKSC